MRVATIDIGTNTVLLLVAERGTDGALVAVTERARITRLGEGVDRFHRLSPAAVARTNACLEEYALAIRQSGAEQIAVVGTSAMRDAEGGEHVRDCVQRLFGVTPRVITGEEEARLTFRGAVHGLSVQERDKLAIFDIGGGSTEVATGQMYDRGPHLAYARSFDVGSVRLTERHVTHDPPTQDEREVIVRVARDTFATVPPLEHGQLPIGIAGTMTTIAAVSLGLATYDGSRVHGHPMQRAEVRRVVDLLAKMPLAERRCVPGMEPQRADVIVAGGCVALALLDHWSVDMLLISDCGVRWGLAEELTQERLASTTRG